MSNGMQKLAESSEKLLNISKDVSASSITSTDRSNSVATASEEMTQTITEIAKISWILLITQKRLTW